MSLQRHFSVSRDDFWAQHGPKMGPFWSHVDHFLEHFWVFFWHLNLRSLLRRFFVDFWLLFDSPHPQKHRPCRWIRGYLHLLHDRSWDRSWTDFGSILEPKIDPKSVPKRLENVSNFIVDFESHPGPPKINFWANMVPIWPPLGLENVPKWNPNWCPNRSQNGSGEPKWPPDPPGSTFGRFFVDFDWNFVAFWTILIPFWQVFQPLNESWRSLDLRDSRLSIQH